MTKFRFKRFQIEDIARAAMHDGVIISWEPGLGKTIAALAWAIIKGARRVLLVVPGGLHKQFRDTAQAMFGIHITSLPSVRHFEAHKLGATLKSLRKDEKPRFFITSYQDLGYNGGDEWPDTVTEEGLLATRADRLKARLLDPQFVKVRLVTARFTGKPFDPKPYFEGIGTVHDGIRCIWKPTLSNVIAHSIRLGGGFDCVVVDEGTRLQASESHISLGVRQLDPKFRLVLTGTPIKNRLESFFWLAQWACGGSATPTARWPYEATSEAREQFANQHLQHDRFLTREEEMAEKAAHKKRSNQNPRAWTHSTWNAGSAAPRSGRKIEKRSARLCNIHRLWKLIAPIVIRRRREDCGEDIVKRILKPITIQPGTAQQKVYRFHLANPPQAARATPTKKVDRRVQIGMQLGCLRQAALCPEADALAQTVVDPAAAAIGPRRSWTDANPKQAAVLSLIADLLEKGENVIVGSPFTHFSASLHRRLTEARVGTVLLDGSVSQLKRGEMADHFKQRKYSVLVAGVNAMGEGHSFECCSHLILPSLSWAYDENKQFLDRIWRLNSHKDVTIYTFATLNSIDEKLARLFTEKGDSANLALDGRLIEEQVAEIDLSALLKAAVRDFNPGASTVDEQDIEAAWPALRDRLARAESSFRGILPDHFRRAHTAPAFAPSTSGLTLLSMIKRLQAAR